MRTLSDLGMLEGLEEFEDLFEFGGSLRGETILAEEVCSLEKRMGMSLCVC